MNILPASFFCYMTIFMIALSSCNTFKTNSPTEKQGEIIPLTNDLGYDFTKLDHILSEKRIVALGESSHGNGELFKIKTELVKYLHEKHGFNVVAFEASEANIHFSMEEIDKLDGKALMDATAFGNFNCEEMLPLFKYIKSKQIGENELKFTGFDIQILPSVFGKLIKPLTDLESEELSVQFDESFSHYYNHMKSSYSPDSTDFTIHRTEFTKAMDANKNAILKHKVDILNNELLSESNLELILHTFDNLKQQLGFDYKDRFTAEYVFRGVLLRDSLMALKIVDQLENTFPNQKMIVWAHNGHVEKGARSNSSSKMMGHILEDKYNDDYYSLGIFVYKGKAYQHWTGETVEFENADSSFVEARMKDSISGPTFIDISSVRKGESNAWVYDQMMSREIENGDTIRFVPSERFDGLLTCFKSDIPTFY